MGACGLNHEITLLEQIELLGLDHRCLEGLRGAFALRNHQRCNAPHQLKTAGNGAIRSDGKDGCRRPELADVASRGPTFGERKNRGGI